jgi:hypothetical protein
MKKPLALIGSITLACLSSVAGAQQTQPPAFGEPAPVPGTEGAITSPEAAIADQVFVTNLSGLAEIPPRDTEASGAFVAQLNPDGTSLNYRLSVQDIQDVTGAHLHLGLPNENGPIVVPLLGEGAPGDNATPPPAGPASGVIAEGEITAETLAGPLAGVPLVVLMELLRSGAIYVNVHTTQFPQGELRGQPEGIGGNADAIVELLQDTSGTGGTDGEVGGGEAGGGGTDDGATGGGASDGGTTGGGTTDDGATGSGTTDDTGSSTTQPYSAR